MRKLFQTGLLYTALMSSALSIAAQKKSPLPPFVDPNDLLVRMAPMAKSSRSLVINLSTNLRLAFDAQNLRTHTVWKGAGLKLYGPGYHGAKRPFICKPNGDQLWGNPPTPMWALLQEKDVPSSKSGTPVKTQYLGYSTRGGRASVLYQLHSEGRKPTKVHHSFHAAKDAVVRSIRVSNGLSGLRFMAHAEKGKPIELNLPGVAAIQRESDILVAIVKGNASVTTSVSPMNFEEEQFTEEGSTKGNEIVKTAEEFTCIDVSPALTGESQFDVVSFTVPDLTSARRIARNWKHFKVEFNEAKPLVLKHNTKAPRSFSFDPFYETESFSLPDTKKMNLFVTGMDWLNKDQLAVCTYGGDVWIIEGATDAAKSMKFRRFARGMNEPMGLLVNDGKIHLGNKAEITRLDDSNDDGQADLFERVSSDWDYTGSYNSFSYGPVLDRQSRLIVANAGHAGHWGARHMGWALQVAPGELDAKPFASGFREPNGIGTFGAEKDLFVTDNQGAWVGACKLNHVKEGRFFGHPSSRPAPRELYGKPRELSPPAVWFPYKWVRSASGMVEITDERFGPFKGQMLVGDFQNAVVTRVQLEKIEDEWQGAVWPFLKGFRSGVNRLIMGDDGRLYVGGGKVRAWAANAPAFHALERVRFKGQLPFEVKAVRALADGFELNFTKPVDPETAKAVDGYAVWQYQFKYHKNYGSPEFDHEGRKDSSTAIEIAGVDISEDRLKVRLKLKGLKEGFVTGVRALDLRDPEGKKLWHDTFHYTLNKIPAGR